MQSALDVLSQIRGFEHPDRLEPARGLSNRVFFLTAGGEEYVFRLANAHAEQLGSARCASRGRPASGPTSSTTSSRKDTS